MKCIVSISTAGVLLAPIAVVVLAASAYAQGPTGSGKSGSPTSRHDLPKTEGFGNGREYHAALGLRLDGPGSERLTLRGTLTRTGGTVPFAFTRELDEDSRIDFGLNPTRSLVAAGLRGTPAMPASLSDDDRGLVETLYDDSPEAFCYSLLHQGGLRFLGAGFRTDDGADAKYTGPYYDIYERSAPVVVLPDMPVRFKHFYFDSTTKLLAKTRYTISAHGTDTAVEVLFSGWRSAGGTMVPGQVVRLENGKAVLTLTVQEVASGASASDGLFGVGGN